MGDLEAGIGEFDGNIQPAADNAGSLGTTAKKWADLFLADGGVINFNNGNFKLSHGNNALTIDTNDKLQFRDANSFIHSNEANDLLLGATDITLDANGDIILDANGADIILKDNGSTFGSFINSSDLLVISSSAGNGIILASQDGTLELANLTADASSDALAIDVSTSNTVSFNVGTLGNKFTRLTLDNSVSGGSCESLISGSLQLKNGAAASELRLFDAGESHYVAWKAPALTGNVTLTLPDNDGDADQVLQTDGSGVLSFASVGAASTVRSLFNVTASLGADTAVHLTGSRTVAAQNNRVLEKLDESDNVSFNSADTFAARGRRTEIYVNGQLLLSGSGAQVTAGTRDYVCDSTTSVKFAFGLEVDDIIQVITR